VVQVIHIEAVANDLPAAVRAGLDEGRIARRDRRIDCDARLDPMAAEQLQEEKDSLVEKMSAIQYPTPKADGSHLLPIWREALVSSFDVPRIPATEVDLLHDFFLELIKIGPRRKESHVAAFSHDITASAKRVKAPTLIISGKRDMWACCRGPELHAAMPNSELREFDTEGEMPRLAPKIWATAVREFLERH
jgi:pimeloyl-ACP methyl ester carboxylesterase